MGVNDMKTTEIARAVGIAPRTKRYEAKGADGYPVFTLGEADGPWEHVLSAIRLARTERQAVDMDVYIAAVAVHKAVVTGRLTGRLRARLCDQYTPYQVCAVIAKIVALYEGAPTIGDLADFWINQHAEQL